MGVVAARRDEYWDLYYPGDEYVDWVATGVLTFGPIAQWSRWWTLSEIFGAKYPRLASFGKPVMIAELGSFAVGGDRQRWYETAIEAIPRDYPAVRAVMLFHARDDQTVTYQKVDWTVVGDSALSDAIRESLAANSLACRPIGNAGVRPSWPDRRAVRVGKYQSDTTSSSLLLATAPRL